MATRSRNSPSHNRKRTRATWSHARSPDRLIRPVEEETYIVQPNEHGMRLDMYIKLKLKHRSRTKAQRLIEERGIHAGDARVDSAYRVKMGEKIRVPLPPPGEAAERIHEIPLEILHEDELLVILNKQPDIVVHPAGKHRYDTLLNALHLRYRRPDSPAEDIVPRLAHRIDRDTSGVLIAIKMRARDRRAPFVFEKAKAEKEYLVLVEGNIADDSGVIDLPLMKDPQEDPNCALMVVRPEGQVAKTGFIVRERFGDFTFVQARLFTGRQHQIRAHFRAIGHPVVCDAMYGKRKELRLSELRLLAQDEPDVLLLKRQALHSWRVAFHHPLTGGIVRVEASLPADIMCTLEALRLRGKTPLS